MIFTCLFSMQFTICQPRSKLIHSILYPPRSAGFLSNNLYKPFLNTINDIATNMIGLYIRHEAGFPSNDLYRTIFNTLHHFESKINGFYIPALSAAFLLHDLYMPIFNTIHHFLKKISFDSRDFVPPSPLT